MKKFLLTLLVVLFAGSALASDLTIPQSTLYPYKNSIEMQDDFLTGTTTTGSVGALGWSSAGTLSVQNGEANRMGIFRFDTTAVAATQARLSFPAGTSLDPALAHTIIWAFRVNTNDANTTVRVGAQANVNADPPGHGIFLEKLAADTNWFCVTRALGVQTRTDSTVAVNTNFTTMTYTRNSSGVQFNLDGVNICSVMTTNIPTTFISPEIFMINAAAAAKNFDVDYFQFKIFGIVR